MTNKIHSSAIVEDSVILGHNNYIGPNAILLGKTSIGSDNWIGPGVIIGTGPEIRATSNSLTNFSDTIGINIGSRNVIRENTVIQSSFNSATKIGSDNYLMDGVHVGHDCELHDFITMAPKVTLAGHVYVHSNATLGIGASVHQQRVIGAYSMVGMNSAVTRNLAPFGLYAGNPARFVKPNEFQIQNIPEFALKYNSFVGMPASEWPSDLHPKIMQILVFYEKIAQENKE
jgi:UDP-N-acetylglucosamine acyltransferase